MQILTGRHGGGEVMNGHLSDISVYGETSGKMLKLSQLRIMETDRKNLPSCWICPLKCMFAGGEMKQRGCCWFQTATLYDSFPLLISPPTCWDWRACYLTGLWGPVGSDSLRRGRPDGSEWQGDCAGLPPLLLDASSSVSVSIPRLLSRVCVFGRTTSSPPAGVFNANRTLIINTKGFTDNVESLKKKETWNLFCTFTFFHILEWNVVLGKQRNHFQFWTVVDFFLKVNQKSLTSSPEPSPLLLVLQGAELFRLLICGSWRGR